MRERVRGWSADALKAARRAADLSQEALAGRIGCAPSAVSDWESGRSAPHPPLARAAADALGVTVRDLVDLGSEPVTLRDLRAYAGLTQLEARHTLQLRQLGVMERGNMAVPAGVMAKMAKLYGVDEAVVVEAAERTRAN